MFLLKVLTWLKNMQNHLKINPQGGIINQEAPIHVSNVMPIDPKTGEPTRVGYKVDRR